MKNTTLTRMQTGTKAGTRETARTDVETSKVGIGVIGFVAALIGIWGVACFAGGLLNSGGPIAFVKSWFGAVVGM